MEKEYLTSESLQNLIECFVKGEIEKMDKGQTETLEALLHSGYKGERESILKRLLLKDGLEKPVQSSLTESFQSIFESEKAVYWRIKPEFYRETRKQLQKT